MVYAYLSKKISIASKEKEDASTSLSDAKQASKTKINVVSWGVGGMCVGMSARSQIYDA